MMKNKLALILGTLFIITMFVGCNIEPEDPLLLYETEINGGWIAFTKNDFAEAYLRFHQAIEVDSLKAEAYSGLAWILFKQDSLEKAIVMFDSAETMTVPNASLFAGHAFALNALKSYASSNQFSDVALQLDPAWYFPFLGGLNVNDLIVLKAENFFMLGDFPQSFREVNKINPEFKAALDTPSGQAALAAEIEKLKKY